MNYPLLVRVVNRLTYLLEKGQPLVKTQQITVAIIGNGDARDILHGKIGTSAGGRPGIVDPGNIGMVHQGQGLALGCESRENLGPCISRFQHFQGNAPPDRFVLFGKVDDTHAALAQDPDRVVRPKVGQRGGSIPQGSRRGAVFRRQGIAQARLQQTTPAEALGDAFRQRQSAPRTKLRVSHTLCT